VENLKIGSFRTCVSELKHLAQTYNWSAANFYPAPTKAHCLWKPGVHHCVIILTSLLQPISSNSITVSQSLPLQWLPRFWIATKSSVLRSPPIGSSLRWSRSTAMTTPRKAIQRLSHSVGQAAVTAATVSIPRYLLASALTALVSTVNHSNPFYDTRARLRVTTMRMTGNL